LECGGLAPLSPLIARSGPERRRAAALQKEFFLDTRSLHHYIHTDQ